MVLSFFFALLVVVWDDGEEVGGSQLLLFVDSSRIVKGASHFPKRRARFAFSWQGTMTIFDDPTNNESESRLPFYHCHSTVRTVVL